MKKMKFAILALLVLAVVFASCEAALAATKPSWLTVKYTGWTLRRNNKVNDVNAGNYYDFVLKFDLINNSKAGDVMTTIYDRTISWNGVLTLILGDRGTIGGVPTWNLKSSAKGNNPYKGEWYPGQVYKYEYSTSLRSLMDINRPTSGYWGYSWKFINESVRLNQVRFKLGNWNFDCQVRSSK